MTGVCVVMLLMSQVPTLAADAGQVSTAAPTVKVGEQFPTLNDPKNADLATVGRFLKAHLIEFDFRANKGLVLTQNGRDSRFGESIVDAVALVPEAVTIARAADADYLKARWLTYGGLGVALLGTVVTNLALVVLGSSAFVGVLIAGAAVTLVGLVLVLVGLPFAISAQSEFMKAISVYNQALIDRATGLQGSDVAPTDAPPAPPVPGVEREHPLGAPVALLHF